ncbi:Tad domain-containing protein [Alcanivorax sp. ZXX171]|nr:Tad domain-containing protein [Alcanivorax sp. ZXX171]
MKRHHQRGQMTVYVLVMLFAVTAAVYFVHDAYNVSNEKTRLQSTADAAAYSVASVEARNLNIQAYGNRAMIANHVAVAQAVTLVSWTRWLHNTSRNLALVTKWIPYLGAAMEVVKRILDSAASAVEWFMKGAVTVLDKVIAAISATQDFSQVESVAMARQVFEEVVEKNDPQVDTAYTISSLASFSRQHAELTGRYNPDRAYPYRGRRADAVDRSRSDEFRNILLASRDNFTTERRGDLDVLDLLGFFKLKIRKRGGTELSRNRRHKGPYYTWSAVDTLSVHTWTLTLTGTKHNEIPVGWAGSQSAPSNTGRLYRFRETHDDKGYWRDNRVASRMASREYRRSKVQNNYQGMRRFSALKKDGLLSHGRGIIITLTKPGGGKGVKTTSDVTGARDRMKFGGKEDFLKGRMASISKARVEFHYPNDLFPRSDGRREYGSLYNPYWQPSLAPLSDTERAAAIMELGL